MRLAFFVIGEVLLSMGCVGLGMEAYEVGFAVEHAYFLGAAVWFGVTHAWARVTEMGDKS